MKTMRERCREFHQQQTRNAVLRQGDPVEDLMAFVVTEKGRAADKRLEGSLPLVLYFTDASEREEFIAEWKSMHVKTVTKSMP